VVATASTSSTRPAAGLHLAYEDTHGTPFVPCHLATFALHSVTVQSAQRLT
jgi:hypothetical protein